MEKPTTVKDVFIPSSVLDEVVKGCHEHVVEAVREAVSEETELFDGEKAALVATFNGYAFATTGSGKFYRVRFEAKDGKARLQDSKPVNIPVLNRESAQSYVRKEARKMVDSFFSSGLTEDTRNHLHDISQAIIGGLNVTPEGAAGFVAERVGQERRWKQFVEDPGPAAEFIEVDPKRFAPQVKPKFKAVLSGDYDLTKEEEYRTIAIAAMKELASKVSEIANLANETEFSSFTLKQEFRYDDADVMVGEFREFLKDFADDVRGLHDDLQSYVAVMGADRLESIASLHDGVAGKMSEIELAGTFVEKFANRFEAAE